MRYRKLKVGEYIRQSDEIFTYGHWIPAFKVLSWNRKLRKGDYRVRRPLGNKGGKLRTTGKGRAKKPPQICPVCNREINPNQDNRSYNSAECQCKSTGKLRPLP